jgi:formylmethanofuran dehydrogenase subunit B
VTTWRTGFPAAVDFARGYPRFDPWHGTARARLSSGATDAVLVVGDPARIPSPMIALLEGVPPARRCIIGPGASASALGGGATVIDTAVPGIHEDGTVLRMDDVPLPVRAAIEGPPRAREILQALCERIVAVQRDARPESHPAASMTETAGTPDRAARFQRRADG